MAAEFTCTNPLNVSAAFAPSRPTRSNMLLPGAQPVTFSPVKVTVTASPASPE